MGTNHDVYGLPRLVVFVLKPDMHMRSELATHPTQTILITTYFCILKCMKIIT